MIRNMITPKEYEEEYYKYWNSVLSNSDLRVHHKLKGIDEVIRKKASEGERYPLYVYVGVYDGSKQDIEKIVSKLEESGWDACPKALSGHLSIRPLRKKFLGIF